jgi:hypothetical protein
MKLRPQSLPIFGLATLALCSGLLCACGSSGPSSSAIQSTCQDISAVLSDGPDPGADPVGYALAQVKPLREIETSDGSLGSAIDQLAAAYEQFFTTNGAEVAKRAVTAASEKVDSICPGAAS